MALLIDLLSLLKILRFHFIFFGVKGNHNFVFTLRNYVCFTLGVTVFECVYL